MTFRRLCQKKKKERPLVHPSLPWVVCSFVLSFLGSLVQKERKQRAKRGVGRDRIPTCTKKKETNLQPKGATTCTMGRQDFLFSRLCSRLALCLFPAASSHQCVETTEEKELTAVMRLEPRIERRAAATLLAAASVAPTHLAYADAPATLRITRYSHLETVPATSKRLILCRHGETLFNKLHLPQGRLFDAALDGAGQAQAEKLGAVLAQGPPLSVVGSSPRLRAMQTADRWD